MGTDAFEKPTDEPNLELKCKVYNINDGKNKAIMESCGWLMSGFGKFIKGTASVTKVMSTAMGGFDDVGHLQYLFL